MFTPVDPRVSFPQLEDRILTFWKENEIFRRSVEERPEDKLFVFYEGPPTANARPGIHHVLARVFKDLIPRYKTMQGYRVPRKAGWDTHGLPVELEIEKELGLKSKPEIEAYGIAAFNEKCRESVGRYVEEWTRLSERIAFWADLDHPYVTYHNEYIESCWWIFKSLWDANLVYQDYRVTPHCARCGTSLSDHEVSQGYEDNTPDPSVFVKFAVDPMTFSNKLVHRGMIFSDPAPVYLVAWTTTPWTLPGNTALAVKDDAVYGMYAKDDEYLVLASALAEKVFGEPVEPLATFYGEKLAGLQYEPLYRPEQLGSRVLRFGEDGRLGPIEDAAEADGLRRVIVADYVSMDDGSGIVHTAPAFGGEDFDQGKLHRLLFAQPLDLRGIMAEGLPGAGKFAKQADKDVIAELTERGLMLRSETKRHTYPFCWRCHTPLLYYAKPSWYIRTTAQKEALMAGNERINWYPDHIQHGRFGNWLENNIDWAFSRERYWGTPLPFWRCEACETTMCAGSREDLQRMAVDPDKVAAMTDLHRPYIDDIEVRCQSCGGTARRVPEVADAWFDSGAMPYAQWGYPYTNDEGFHKAFPADFICEAIDQTRGWFYTLHAEATMLKAAEAIPDGISFKNVIVLGHIQDEKGNKMSKSRGNAVEPWTVLDQHGADATRWYMYTASPAGSSRRFSLGLVEEGLRRFLLTLWNTYSFFVSYANIDGVDPRERPDGELPEIDRWLLSELNALVITVTDELEAYDPTGAGRAIETFVDDLSNWYVRRSRRRFWRGVGESDADKQAAYYTLYTSLKTLSLLLAPFTPFVAEELWQNLVRSLDRDAPESVHLAEWPKADAAQIDESLNAETQLVKRICSLGRAAREAAQLKVRKPVAGAVVSSDTNYSDIVNVVEKYGHQIADELNAHGVQAKAQSALISPAIEVEPAGEFLNRFLRLRAKPNLKTYGAQWAAKGELELRRRAIELYDLFGFTDETDKSDPGQIIRTIQAPYDDDEVRTLPWPRDGLLFSLESRHPDWKLAGDIHLAVAIDTTSSPELADEGLAREIVRRVQDMRRDAGFDLADRITTHYDGGEDVARVMGSFGDYIRAETLSTELVAGAAPADAHTAEHNLEGTKVTLGVRKNA